MKQVRESFEAPVSRRRAVELYNRDTPFRQKVVPLKTRYSRKIKHRARGDE